MRESVRSCHHYRLPWRKDQNEYFTCLIIQIRQTYADVCRRICRANDRAQSNELPQICFELCQAVLAIVYPQSTKASLHSVLTHGDGYVLRMRFRQARATSAIRRVK
jgi:hypothetical protein